MELTAAFKLIISLALGAAIGLEREVHERNDEHPHHTALIGLRSFSLITALGTVAGLLYNDHFGIFIALTATFMTLLIVHYILNSLQSKDIGITTELAVIFGYLIGLLIGTALFPMQFTIALTVVLILILSLKDQIKNIIEDIEKRELLAFIGYALVALVVLPFLPNKSYALKDIPNFIEFFNAFELNLGNWDNIPLFNPFKTWLIIALITGIDIAGYVLERTIGAGKGLLLSSMVGGFISSTATTQSLAQQSNDTKAINKLVAAAIFANFVSFFPTLFIVSTMNPEFLLKSLPTFIIIILSTFIAGIIFFVKKDAKNADTDVLQKKSSAIFALIPALKFAALYVIISAVSKIAVELFGSSGFLITSAFGALTGIDAVMINTAELAGRIINYQTAVLAFIIINAVNLLGKTTYSFLQGKKEFALKFGVSMIVVIIISFSGLLFI